LRKKEKRQGGRDSLSQLSDQCGNHHARECLQEGHDAGSNDLRRVGFHPHSQRTVRTREDASNNEAAPSYVAIQTFILTSTGLSTRKWLEHSWPHGPGVAKKGPIQSAPPPRRS
jgi:hypothetical protein